MFSTINNTTVLIACPLSAFDVVQSSSSSSPWQRWWVATKKRRSDWTKSDSNSPSNTGHNVTVKYVRILANDIPRERLIFSTTTNSLPSRTILDMERASERIHTASSSAAHCQPSHPRKKSTRPFLLVFFQHDGSNK